MLRAGKLSRFLATPIGQGRETPRSFARIRLPPCRATSGESDYHGGGLGRLTGSRATYQSETMTLALRFDLSRLRQWHVRLAERLAAARSDARGVRAGAAAGISRAAARARADHSSRPAGDMAAATRNDSRAVRGAGRRGTDHRFYRQRGGCRACLARDIRWRRRNRLAAALLNGRTPVVAITDAATNEVIVSGHPGTETAGVFTLALSDVLAAHRDAD